MNTPTRPKAKMENRAAISRPTDQARAKPEMRVRKLRLHLCL